LNGKGEIKGLQRVPRDKAHESGKVIVRNQDGTTGRRGLEYLVQPSITEMQDRLGGY